MLEYSDQEIAATLWETNHSLRLLVSRLEGNITELSEELWKCKQQLFKLQNPDVWQRIKSDPDNALNEYITI